MRPTLRLAVLVLVLATPLSGQELTSEDVRGCYDLHLSSWSDRAEPLADSINYRPPPRIRLSDERPKRGRGEYRIVVPDGSLPSPHSFAWWGIEGTRVRLLWSTGYMGLRGHVRPVEDGLSGEVSRFTDLLRPDREYPTAELTATRVDCSSPTPFPVSESARLMREFELSGGPTLVLGEALPEVELLEAPRAPGAPGRIAGEIEGFLGGHDVLRIRYTPDRILYSIRLEYPEGIDSEALLERLEREIGPWQGSEESETRRTFHWQTRVTGAGLSHTESGRTEIYFMDPRLW